MPNNINILRLGITTPKTVFPKATQRNRVKRLLRETFRLNKGSMRGGYDIVVKPKRLEVEKLSYATLRSELLDLFKQAGLINNL
jgi:ribonuclease P protein component